MSQKINVKIGQHTFVGVLEDGVVHVPAIADIRFTQADAEPDPEPDPEPDAEPEPETARVQQPEPPSHREALIRTASALVDEITENALNFGGKDYVDAVIRVATFIDGTW